VALAGNFKEVLFADLLEFYCLSGQTAAVSVSAADGRGARATGTFFVDGGTLVDARFDGREGGEAVRRAVRWVNTGEFQVDVGARSERRTVHEPWRALVLGEPQHDIEWRASPRHAPADVPVAGSKAPAAIGLGGGDTSARQGPTPAPGRPTGRRPAVSSALLPDAASPTEPFPTLRREFLPGRLGHWLLVFGGSLLAGGALAVIASQVFGIGEEAAIGQSSVVSPRPEPSRSPPDRAVLAGVTETEVTFGMAAPLSGPSKELGRQMKLGLEVSFAAANAEGGVHGRHIQLVALDDGYEPARTRVAVRELAEERGVFGFVGNVGTPNAAATLTYALGRRMLFFGPLTGAASVRQEPPDRTVFNYRASSLEETAAIVRYLLEVRRLRPDQIAVFAQDDGYGDAGYQGVLQALLRYPKARPILKVTYRRNTADVSAAVTQVLDKRDRLRAVVMIATYRAAARFIERVLAQRPQMIFANVSLVGSQALAEELSQLGPRFAGGVIVTQVVPLPNSHSSAVLRYQDALARYAPGEKPDFGSLEGYVVGNLLLEGLRRSGRTVTTDNMVRALETIRGLDLGLGTQVAFGPTEHQGSHRVWGTVLDATGSYQPLELE
jgi:branched-chain amino acid transport system substrate-binding protein